MGAEQRDRKMILGCMRSGTNNDSDRRALKSVLVSQKVVNWKFLLDYRLRNESIWLRCWSICGPSADDTTDDGGLGNCIFTSAGSGVLEACAGGFDIVGLYARRRS